MAAMQQELNRMQQLKGELKSDETRFQKSVQNLQRELENVSRSLTATHAKKAKLQRELKACDEELAQLEERKKQISAKIFNASEDVERKKATKLRAVTGSPGDVAASVDLPAQPSNASLQGSPADFDLLGFTAGPSVPAGLPSAPVPAAASTAGTSQAGDDLLSLDVLGSSLAAAPSPAVSQPSVYNAMGSSNAQPDAAFMELLGM